MSAARKILKVVCDPYLAAAILNAQVRLRRKANVPLSVRLHGRVHFRAGGDVKFGDGVCLVGTVVPIEIVSHEGSFISIGDHTFINYGASITTYREVRIGRHCLLGHYLRIVDRKVEAQVSLSARLGAPGTPVTLSAIGLPPTQRVEIAGGAPGDEYRVIRSALTSAEGTLQVTEKLPAWADPQRKFIFVIASPDIDVAVRSATFDVLEPAGNK